MKRIFFVLLAVVVASSVAAGGAVALPENETDATVPDPTGPTQYAGHVGNTVHIVSASVQGGEWTIVLEADAVSRVTVTDTAATMGRLDDSGSGNFDPDEASRTVTVMPDGQTKVTLEAAEFEGGQAISVIANGDGWFKSTGMSNDPFRYFGGTSGLMTGMALAMFCSGGAAWYIVRKQNEPVARAD